VALEGTRLLAYETAGHRAPADRVAVVASRAARLAGDVVREAHQLHGAVGFTREHDLHLFTMRLRGLVAELGPAPVHAAAAARARWRASSPSGGVG
jgi:alkylation response protein AidB-like acyl-CoA dehydrogenase